MKLDFGRTTVLVLGLMLIGSAGAVRGDEGAGTSYSRLFVLADDTGEVVGEQVQGGRSTLSRTADGACVSIDTRDLAPGAYTMWMRAFNDPDNCPMGEGVGGSQCSRVGIGPSGCVGAGTCSVFWIGSGFVGPDGRAHFSACVEKGVTPGYVIIGPDGLSEPETAEIHLVLKHHGDAAFAFDNPQENERLGRQLTRLNGNCEGDTGDEFDNFDDPDALPNNCVDQQIALYPPSYEDECLGTDSLCLRQDRFSAKVTWSAGDQSGQGNPLPFPTDNSGIFWFFSEDNWEVMVKVLDGCHSNGHFWVFSSASTTLEYTLTVTDTLTGESREYSNDAGVTAPAVTDTMAFATCP
jgi:hypothetical protein